MSRYLLAAKKFHQQALAEFESADSDDTRIRQAAEKGWGAVVQAANHLLEKRKVKVPRGTQKRLERLVELEDRDSRLRKAAVADRYRAFLHTLHSECFYDGTYSVKLVQRELRRLGDFIRQVEVL
jgi:hypothetical protein